MERDDFYTLKKRGESLYKEKGSKFIGIALNLNSEEEFKAELENLRKQYHDARHICNACKIGDFEAKSDDGEPNHSAGDPILGQIHAHDLNYTGVFVIRYFGGTKLGVGGLIQAYKQAALEAIQDAGVVKKYIKQKIDISFPYEQSSQVMKLMDEYKAEIIEQNYLEYCQINIAIRKSLAGQVCKKLDDIAYLGVRFKTSS